MKYLAVDFGEKRVGFAVGETFTYTASPVAPADRRSDDQIIEYMRQLLTEYDIDEIIIGLPLHMDGAAGDGARRVESFAAKVRSRLQTETRLVDERLTSFEAETALMAHIPDFRKRKKILDSISAAVLLQGFLDGLARNP